MADDDELLVTFYYKRAFVFFDPDKFVFSMSMSPQLPPKQQIIVVNPVLHIASLYIGFKENYRYFLSKKCHRLHIPITVSKAGEDLMLPAGLLALQ